MTIQTRKATAEEIIEANAVYLRNGWKVGFRHFAVEFLHPRAKNGVGHKTHGRSKMVIVDGVPHVNHHGELHAITGTHLTLTDSGTTMVADLRLDSPYLK